MIASNHLVVFALDGLRFALPLAAVERIVPAVEVTPLPRMPRDVLGVIDVQGRVVPVVGLRGRCGLPAREVELSDQLILARTSKRPVALLVDSASVLEHAASDAVPAADVALGFEGVREVVKTADGLILICDLDSMLSLEDEQALGGVAGGLAAGGVAAGAAGGLAGGPEGGAP